MQLGDAAAPPRQLLPVPAAGHQTVAVLSGAAQRDRVVLRLVDRRHPAGRPGQRLRRRPGDSMGGGRALTPVGQWIQINFDHPVGLPATVGDPPARRQPRPGDRQSLRVSTAAGSVTTRGGRDRRGPAAERGKPRADRLAADHDRRRGRLVIRRGGCRDIGRADSGRPRYAAAAARAGPGRAENAAAPGARPRSRSISRCRHRSALANPADVAPWPGPTVASPATCACGSARGRAGYLVLRAARQAAGPGQPAGPGRTAGRRGHDAGRAARGVPGRACSSGRRTRRGSPTPFVPSSI